jgi:hypothetical protein
MLSFTMTPRARYTFYIDDEQRAELTAIKERDGISESEQIRRAVQEWIAKRGVSVKSQGKRAVTRKPR